jgi:hypothetical protein
MRFRLVLCVVLATASVSAVAKDLKAYQAGKLVQMESVPCATGKTRELLCQEYILQTDRVTYHIRPRDAKHKVLLPLSDRAEFRIEKETLVLRVEDLDNKDREFTVVSLSPRADSSAADASSPRLNHLQ